MGGGGGARHPSIYSFFIQCTSHMECWCVIKPNKDELFKYLFYFMFHVHKVSFDD